MENKETIKENLKRAGYQEIHEYVDESNVVFPEHDHEGTQCMVVVRGSISVTMDGQEHILVAGSELTIPAKTKHSAKVGSEGCESLLGEKI